MPITLTIVRHGESESNLAKTMFERGEILETEDELMKVHTSERRLTPAGIKQAQLAGQWLREHWWLRDGDLSDYRLFVSPYVRAMETAGHFGFGKDWKPDPRLMERNWGEFDQLPYSERVRLFEEQLELRKNFAYFWRPTNGETFQEVFLRLRDMNASLHRSCPKHHALLVCHGETMWVWRTVLEGWALPQQLRDAMLKQTEQVRIRNCRIIQYTRHRANGSLAPRLVRVRFINPENPDDPETNLDWREIPRKRYTHEELVSYAEGFPTFIPISESA